MDVDKMIYLILSMKVLTSSTKSFQYRDKISRSMAINIYFMFKHKHILYNKVVFYVMDTSSIRTPSKTSLEFSPLYSAAHAGSSVECVMADLKLTNWINSLPWRIFPSADTLLAFYDISTQVFLPEAKKSFSSLFLPLCYPLSCYIQREPPPKYLLHLSTPFHFL